MMNDKCTIEEHIISVRNCISSVRNCISSETDLDTLNDELKGYYDYAKDNFKGILNSYVRAEIYLSALYASGVISREDKKQANSSDVKRLYLNYLNNSFLLYGPDHEDLNSEIDKSNSSLDDEVALHVLSIVKNGPDFILIENLSRQGFIEDTQDFKPQEEYIYNRLKLDGEIDNKNAQDRLYDYIDIASEDYKILKVPFIFNKFVIAVTAVGVILAICPILVTGLASIFPTLATVSTAISSHSAVFYLGGGFIAWSGVTSLIAKKQIHDQFRDVQLSVNVADSKINSKSFVKDVAPSLSKVIDANNSVKILPSNNGVQKK